jgi:nitrate reductase (NAD(P)H)
MIIPGFIGGRMVKFLTEISVTEQESDNFYHFHDNRVMPPHVDEELAKKEGEWGGSESEGRRAVAVWVGGG